MQSMLITDIPRTTTKQAWKWISRYYRICAKKALKASKQAMSDLMVYGTAVTEYRDGEIINIHPKDLFKCQIDH